MSVVGRLLPAVLAFGGTLLMLASAPIVSPLGQASWIVDNRLAGAPHVIRKAAATALAAGRTMINYLDFDVRPTLASLC